MSIRYGTPPASSRLIQDFTELDQIGPPAFDRMLDAMDAYLIWDNEMTAGVLRPFVRKLDARIANRLLFLGPAYFPLQDLNLAARLCRDLMRRAPSEMVGLNGWCTDFLGDERGLLALIDREDLDLGTRSSALSHAIEKGRLSDAIIQQRYRKLLEESDYARAFTAPYLDYLENQARPADIREARRVVEEFLSRHKPEGLLYSIYRGRLAHLMELEGDYSGAWAVIEPELNSGAGAIMYWAASILQRLGRRDEAMALAKQAVERYPDDTRGTYVELLWRERRYSQAALELDRPQQVSASAWRFELAPLFQRTFRDREERDAIEAFDPLVAQKITRFHLQYLIEPFAVKRPSLAFALQSRLKRPYVMDIIGPRFLAYKYLKAWKGEEEALRWLRENLPQNMREAGSLDYYNEEEFDLLWTLVEPLPGKELSPWTWLLRSAAAVFRGLDKDPHREALLAHYSDSSPDYYHALGRYLLGLENATDVERLAMSAKERSEAAYFFGVRALGEGRVPEAADWYRVVIETEPPEAVMLLARRALTRWSDRTRAPDVMKGKVW